VAHQEDTYWGNTCGASWLEKQTEMPSNGSKVAWFLQAYVGRTCAWLSGREVAFFKARQKHGDLLVFDEVQAGFGRTGRWFGYQWYGLKPDMVVGGKAAAGGLPFAFVAARKDLADANPAADYPSTFSANSVSCAAFVETVNIIKRNRLVQKAHENGKVIEAALGDMKHDGLIETYNGRGMAWAAILGNYERPGLVLKECQRRRLLLLDTGRGGLKIAPPLMIAREDLGKGLGILRQSLK